jgi:hypothetical protein
MFLRSQTRNARIWVQEPTDVTRKGPLLETQNVPQISAYVCPHGNDTKVDWKKIKDKIIKEKVGGRISVMVE